MQTYHVEVDDNKTVRWYDKPKGKLHRIGGPAVEGADGSKHWYLNGKVHRADGPAVEFSNGDKLWYLHGKLMTEQEFLTATKTPADCQGKVVEIDGKKYKLTLV
jgi:hypothetical protein